MNLSTLAKEFFAIEDVLNHKREQAASVKGKDTPYRVEFRYPPGSKSWQYFASAEDAMKAKDARASYPFGRARIELPRSQQIQFRGPRGGWHRLDHPSSVQQKGEK